MTRDADLLRHYAESRSEAAFGELVQRHLNLVYFAALRRTGGNAALAEDIVQEVFAALGRQAAPLARHAVLPGWLYTTTRFIAAKAVRAERRRKEREQEAHIMNELSRDPEISVDWEKLQPVIDEALDELDGRDREAVLMRCLQNRPFSEIGVALSLTEDSARKRVERALDKLHTLLARRGVTSTAAALAVAFAHQAGVAAPAGLAANVTSATLTSSATVGAFERAAEVLFSMSTKKMAVGLTAFGLLGLSTALYMQRQPAHEKVSTKPASAMVAVAPPPKNDVSEELKALQQENRRLREIANSISGGSGGGVAEKVARLRTMLERLPEQRIPELHLVTEDDWYAAVDGPLESIEDYRLALSKLRGRAEKRFANEAQPALVAFMRANQGKFPLMTSQLKPFLAGQLDDAMLERYRIVPVAEVPFVKMGGEWVITQASLVDSAYDSRVAIGPHGHGSSYQKNDTGALLDPVIQAFIQANPGVPPNDPAQLLPFAATPEQRAAIDHLARTISRR